MKGGGRTTQEHLPHHVSLQLAVLNWGEGGQPIPMEVGTWDRGHMIVLFWVFLFTRGSLQIGCLGTWGTPTICLGGLSWILDLEKGQFDTFFVWGKETTAAAQRSHRHKSRNKGGTSTDRSTKATLMLTVPRSITKSSTEDLTRPTF